MKFQFVLRTGSQVLSRHFRTVSKRDRFSRSRLPGRRLLSESLEDRMMLSTLNYATFMGGSLSDSAFAVAADIAGNTYLTGTTVSSNFPITAVAFDKSLNGFSDAFVAKFRPDGTLAWATYLGGDLDERGHGIVVDAAGSVFVTGRTDSTNFPTTAGSLDATFNGGVDAFVTKLNANGALVYSTYLGGSGFEIDEGFDKLARRVGAIAVDTAGNAYVTGSTTSNNFPITPGAFRSANAGFSDLFVSKLNATGSALVYSTYLGGSDFDRGYGIAVDANRNAYLTGEVVSLDFPTTAGAFQPGKAGGFSDNFVTKLSATGSTLIYSSYLGGTGGEVPGRLALDTAGQAYLTGATDSFDFPTTAGAFQTARATNGFDAFVAKVNVNGSALVFATYLGGSFGNDFAEGIAVDGNGQAYVSGQTNSGAFPVRNAFQPATHGLSDAFVTKLNATGSALVYSSYLGGERDDLGFGIAVDANQTAHMIGRTSSPATFSATPFPTTAGAFQPALGGGNDAFIARIVSTDQPPPPVPLPTLSLNNTSHNEGNKGTTEFIFTVTLSAASLHTVVVNYSTANGTAQLANSDYVAASGTLTFAPGETTKRITIRVNGDRRVEPNETFFVNLTNAKNATLGDAQGRGIIVNDDGKSTASKFTSLGSRRRESILVSADALAAWSNTATRFVSYNEP